MAASEGLLLTVREVADALGVSAQRVRRMISDGVLPARRSSAGWLVPSVAVAQRSDQRHRGRPVGASTVWAVIGVLAESSAETLSDRRLRHRVRTLLDVLPDPVSDPAAWRLALARRGQLRRFWVHPGLRERLENDSRVSLANTAAVERGAGLSGGHDVFRAYVSARDADDVVRRYRLREDPDNGVVLVVVPDGVPADLAPRPGEPVPLPAAVADLLDEDDPRARHGAALQLRSMWQAAARGGS
jgi:excisionase family DNA binding protein